MRDRMNLAAKLQELVHLLIARLSPTEILTARS